MSLLLELINKLLEYLGVPAQQLVPVWERFTRRRITVRATASHFPLVLFEELDLQYILGLERKNYGWTRSVVRIIGTLLPLEQCPRPHLQKILGPEVLEAKDHDTVGTPVIPSLADAPCLLDDHVMTCTRFRHDLPSHKSMEELLLARPSNTDSGFLSTMAGNRVPENSLLSVSDNAIQKIAALEDELMQLRAQIAAIVAMQESKAVQSLTESMCSFGSPSNALQPPSSASTPLSAQFLQFTTPVAVPPPPPPPPPPAPSAKSAIDLIKERKASHKCSPMEELSQKGSVETFPSMMDVLKGMNSIKLRAVERSPGGTPLTRKDKRRSLNDPTDPAAIIARALKQKFAHRRNDDDKENRSYEESPFSSPETPMFGRHLLKSSGKRTQQEISRKQVHV